jgi:hypothetical protein
LQTNLFIVQTGKIFRQKSTKEAFFEVVFYQVLETEPRTFSPMDTSTTPNPVPEGGATEIPQPTEPPKPKSERLVDSSQIGLDVVYEPTKAPGSKTVRIDVEYAIHFLTVSQRQILSLTDMSLASFAFMDLAQIQTGHGETNRPESAGSNTPRCFQPLYPTLVFFAMDMMPNGGDKTRPSNREFRI